MAGGIMMGAVTDHHIGQNNADPIVIQVLGYGIVAEVFLSTMKANGLAGVIPNDVPWSDVIGADACLRNAPGVWNDVRNKLTTKSLFWDVLFRAVSSKY